MRQLEFGLIRGVFLCAMLALPRLALAEPVGFIAAVKGNVEIQEAASTPWQAGLIDRDLEIGNILRTEAASAAKVLLIDETMLTLGESTELEIESFLVGAAARRDPSILRLLKGRARVAIGEAFGGPTRVEMHTPTAVIGVKGSEYVATLKQSSSGWVLSVQALSGRVWVRPLTGPGRQVDLVPNTVVEVSADGQVSEAQPAPLPPAEVEVESESESAETVLFGEPGVAAAGGAPEYLTPAGFSPPPPAPAAPVPNSASPRAAADAFPAPAPSFIQSPQEGDQVSGIVPEPAALVGGSLGIITTPTPDPDPEPEPPIPNP